MVPGSRAEVPDPGITCSGQQAISDQLVTGPLANDGARNVSDIVLIETQHRTETGFRQRLAGAREAISMQALEIDTFFKIHLSGSRCLQRPVPAVSRLEIVFIDGQKFGSVYIFHDSNSA